SFGIAAAEKSTYARVQVSSALGCLPTELMFTSGGTESNNAAIFSHAAKYYRAGKRIITQKSEHPSVLEPIKRLESEGFEVDYVPVDNGNFDYAYFKKSLLKGACLVSIMQANNQTGCLFDLKKIRESMLETNSSAMLHCDAVQGFLKTDLDNARNLCKYCDTVSISAHKIGGLKGCGALFIKKGVRFKPFIVGGEQESSLRGGTENIVGTVAFGAAVNDVCKNKDYAADILARRNEFLQQIDSALGEKIKIFIPKNHINSILNISVAHVKSEVCLNYLSSRGIFLSASSACSSRTKENPTLEAFGLSKEYIYSSLRIAFSPFNTSEEVKILVDALKIASEL
ncbi:MAG: aminotransferase class V-fold PLP-dependent enzyme, partial [Clostridia bacterium]